MSKFRVVKSANILPGILGNLFARVVRSPKKESLAFAKDLWHSMKLRGASNVVNVDLNSVLGIESQSIEFSAANLDRAVVCAVTKLLDAKTFFEFGTFRGETTLAVAKTNPQVHVYTLDLPTSESRKNASLEMTDEYLFETWDRGLAFSVEPEADRIESLRGDSATFDFSPYDGKIDVVFIDASHSYSYVKSDTEAALKMLRADGTILWHDYPAYPGIYAYLNELAAEKGNSVCHLMGTGLAIMSRREIFSKKA